MYFEEVLGGERRVIVKSFSLFCLLVFGIFFLSFTANLILHLFLLTIRGIKKAEMQNIYMCVCLFKYTSWRAVCTCFYGFFSSFGWSVYSKVPISWLTYCSGRTQGSCRPGTRQAGWLRGESCCFSLPAADTSTVRIPLVQESVVVLHSTFIGVLTG